MSQIISRKNIVFKNTKMVEFEIETIDIGLFVRMSSDYVIPIFSDYVILIFRRQEVTYLRTRYIPDYKNVICLLVLPG